MRFTWLIAAALAVGLAGGVLGYRVGTGGWPTSAAIPAPAHGETPAAADAQAAHGRKVLYYRNPMGLPDTSPVPKKDWMGMDYIAVHEGDEQQAGDAAFKVTVDRVQRGGVRTEKVGRRILSTPVRVPGTVQIDESRIKVVTLRFDGFIEDLFVAKTGEAVRAGQPLFRVYSSQIQQAQVDLLVAMREQKARPLQSGADMTLGPIQRLRNLGVPEKRIREVRESGDNPRTIDWPSPMAGVVLEKRIVDGQRATMGSELYRIADLSVIWVIAEVPEQELPQVRVGSPAAVTLAALPGEERLGKVTFVYPVLKAETRTVRVRVELPNADGKLKADMYASVIIDPSHDGTPAIAVPDSAVIDAGTRQVVFVAKGEGRFEPRAVKLGRRGEGYAEILEGVSEGEEVVAAATFLIDAESNLKAALQNFTRPEAPK